jgi:hypothetical protein
MQSSLSFLYYILTMQPFLYQKMQQLILQPAGDTDIVQVQTIFSEQPPDQQWGRIWISRSNVLLSDFISSWPREAEKQPATSRNWYDAYS